ncbi:Uncharacterised protein [uncultured Dorea sp.]|uniref:hypothetical protein n=1 Tax=Dorea formicigenerans TaxID=39486 RepID=UPI0008234186|nr:hypothetical protein [uncultured Dorea sp.]SCH77587.1 Uncharacterised protein [uncultured Dorea sp.]
MSGLKPITVNTAPEAEPNICAEDDAAIYQSIFGEDGVSSIGQACKATVLSNNKVRIADGVICVGGHFARIPYGDYIDCDIENGQSGKNRNDIIVARFETTGTGGIDTYTCEVKKGAAGTAATDPKIVQEDLYKAGKVRELPLYRVKIEGLSITAVEQLFALRKTNEDLEKELAELNSNKKVECFSKTAATDVDLLVDFSEEVNSIIKNGGKIVSAIPGTTTNSNNALVYGKVAIQALPDWSEVYVRCNSNYYSGLGGTTTLNLLVIYV